MHIEQIHHKNPVLNHIHCHQDRFSAKLFPHLGGSIQELIIDGINIIDGISIDQQGLTDYASSYKSSILFPFPNRIKDGLYTYGDQRFQLPINERPLQNSLHGLVYNKEFKVLQCTASSGGATIKMKYGSNGELTGYPFAFELFLLYHLNTDGNVILEIECENKENHSIPVGMGWHPYFLTNNLNTSELIFSSKHHFVNDDRNVPVERVKSPFGSKFKIGEQAFDDAWSTPESKVQLNCPDYQALMSYGSDHDSFLQIYTPPHRKNIAIEPMTCVANSFNNKIGLQEIQPASTKRWKILLTVKPV